MHSLFRTLYRRPTLPIAFTLLRRSETLYSGQQPRPGDAQKRTSIKTQKRDKVKRFFLGEILTFFWLFPLGDILSPQGKYRIRHAFLARFVLTLFPNPQTAEQVVRLSL
jgi:hypothetical protein